MIGRTTRNTRRSTPAIAAPAAAAPSAAPAERSGRRSLGTRAGAWRDQHLYGFFSSLGRLAARPWATALTVLVLGFALALPLLFVLVQDNAHGLAAGVRTAREITIFLKPETNARAAEAFAAELRGRADLAEVSVRTPDQGLAEFRDLAGFSAAIEAMKDNPLPFVLVATPAASVVATDPHDLLGALGADARVDLVQYDAVWRRKLSGLLDFGDRLVTVIAALLALATLLVIGNTVRMDIQSRAEEIAVMQLIGASDGFVRRPYVYAGLWYGLLGALLAVALVLAVELALAAPLNRLLENYADGLVLRGLRAPQALLLVATSGVLGWLGAWIAVSRHLAAGRPRA